MCKGRISRIVMRLILAALVGGLGWLFYTTLHQEWLNHALLAAIKKNDTKTALALLAEGADPNARGEPPQSLSFWRLLLDRLQSKRTAPSRASSALQLLLRPTSQPNNVYYIPWAFPVDNPPLVQALLNKGANPNIKDSHGATLLLWAIQAEPNAHQRTIQLLIEHGADVNARTDQDLTPFYLALLANANEDIIKAMLKHGASVNLMLNGYTSLMLACNMEGRPGNVKWLLLYHADPNIRNLGGDTVLHMERKAPWASFPNTKQIIQLLKQAGAKE